MNQIIPYGYHLEVSSPGLDRPLRTLEAVARYAGQRAQVTLVEPHDGRRNFDGVLQGPDGQRVGLRTPEGEEHWFEWADVRSARLVVDPWERARGRAAVSHGGERHEQ